MEGQTSMTKCPDVESGTSYGMNNMANFIRDDEIKVLMLDHSQSVTENNGFKIVHPDNPTTDSCDTWDADAALRHQGTANVLYSDGRVVSQTRGQIDPCVEALHDKLWLPQRFDPEALAGGGGGGVMGNYFAGNNFNGVSASRMDTTLNCPFGASFFGHANDYNIPSPVSDQFPGVYKFGSAYWTGKIKANYSEPYIFWMASDNNGKLYINGSLVLQRDAGGSGGCPGCVDTFVSSAPVNMMAGQWVDFRLECVELGPGGSPSHIYVEWESPSTPRGDVPGANLRPF
jgi:prepilin-type processing-associated H-X9-DG protein